MLDQSPELRNGELKDILANQANAILPDFEFLSFKNNCYTFQRLKNLNTWTVYETIHVNFSLKERNFACSIASRLNQSYIHKNAYNSGLVNPHYDLKALRYNSGVLKLEDSYYFHNGQLETTSKVVCEIFKDYTDFGLPFLDNQLARLKNSKLIKTGLAYIDSLLLDKQNLRLEIDEELRKSGLILSNIKHPVFIDLKETLQKVEGQSREDRQMITRTTFELLELYVRLQVKVDRWA